MGTDNRTTMKWIAIGLAAICCVMLFLGYLTINTSAWGQLGNLSLDTDTIDGILEGYSSAANTADAAVRTVQWLESNLNLAKLKTASISEEDATALAGMLVDGSISPFDMVRISFMFIGYTRGLLCACLVLTILLFAAVLALGIVTIIMNWPSLNKYFSPLWLMIAHSLLAILFLIFWLAMRSAYNGLISMVSSSAGSLGAPFVPTFWLVLGEICAVAPMFLLSKPPKPQPQPKPTPGPDSLTHTIPVDDERRYEETLPTSNSNQKGILIEVRYTDNSGTHIVKRRLTRTPMKIGRSKAHEKEGITLDDPTASNVHASLRYDDYGLWIKDLQSTNGITINGQSVVNERNIGPDDTIRLGNSVMQIRTIGEWSDEDGEKTLPSRNKRVPQVRVQLTYDDDTGHRVETIVLSSNQRSVGRNKDNDICIVSPTVSRKHCYLENRGSAGIFICDNESSTGVILNGVTIAKPTQLSSGDLLELGDVRVKVELL